MTLSEKIDKILDDMQEVKTCFYGHETRVTILELAVKDMKKLINPATIISFLIGLLLTLIGMGWVIHIPVSACK